VRHETLDADDTKLLAPSLNKWTDDFSLVSGDQEGRESENLSERHDKEYEALRAWIEDHPTVGGSVITVYPSETILQSSEVKDSIAARLSCIEVWQRREVKNGSQLVFIIPGDLISRRPYVQRRIAAIFKESKGDVHVVVDVGPRYGVRRLADLVPECPQNITFEAFVAFNTSEISATCAIIRFTCV